MTCNAKSGRCVDPSNDMDAPGISTWSTSSPTPLNTGDAITVQFTASELLGAVPGVSLQLTPVRSFTLSSDSNPSFVFTYTVAGDETAGSVDITVELVDTAGNPATLTAGSLEF